MFVAYVCSFATNFKQLSCARLRGKVNKLTRYGDDNVNVRNLTANLFHKNSKTGGCELKLVVRMLCCGRSEHSVSKPILQ